jgi:ribosomal protein S18 acetylase RimI-like enzyme
VAVEPTQLSARLRPCAPEDREFLVAVYGSTRADELAMTGWADAEIDDFVRMQFDLQDRHYSAAYPDAERSVILAGGREAGRLYVHRDDDEIRVLDIALLPEFRGRGVGGELLTDLLAEASMVALPVRIHVEPGNPARSLYERLGFVEVGEESFYIRMERPA